MTSEYITTIHTDGGCSPNPGEGAYAAILQHGELTRCVRGYAPDATNQQMELAAAIAALSALKSTHIPVHIHTDSEYVQLGASERLKNWKRNGWRTASGSKVKNLELWQELDALMDRYVIAWYKVEGHAGVEMNVKADHLVTDTREAKGDPTLYRVTDIAAIESKWSFTQFQATQAKAIRPEVAYLRNQFAGILKGTSS